MPLKVKSLIEAKISSFYGKSYYLKMIIPLNIRKWKRSRDLIRWGAVYLPKWNSALNSPVSCSFVEAGFASERFSFMLKINF